MASIETAITARLEAHAGLGSLIGAGDAMRLYSLEFEQGAAMPVVTYQLISEPRRYAFGTTGFAPDARFQIDAWGTTKSQVNAVAAQIRNSLDGYRGTSDTIVIQGIEVLSRMDSRDPASKLYRETQDFLVHYVDGP